jgi:Zn-finger protein
MRISRGCYLTVVAALAAVIVAPATASALLTNQWNQSFAGTAVCINCHTAGYENTSHGQFVKTGTALEPNAASGMYPVTGKSGSSFDETANLTFSLGAGTGLREYIAWGMAPASTVSLFGTASFEWDAASPSIWEQSGTSAISFSNYTCGQCHQLGWTTSGKTVNSITATQNAWAIPAGSDSTSATSYIAGSGIQCEKCHGTGVAASMSSGGHWTSGVKIVGYNTSATLGVAKAASTKLLDSQVCGQCHASFKSGNSAGFTPDATLTDFVTLYTLADVPTTSAFSISTSKFFPNSVNGRGQSSSGLGGQSNLHHSYYTEWALSGHSWRGALTSSSPNATPYQKTVAKHFSSNNSILCNRCHTGEGYLKRKLAVDTPTGYGDIMASVPETTSAEGQLGVECADCHISHGADTATSTASALSSNEAIGMSVRAPEKANGSYSTKGLSVDNASICEDCHNWQQEVMGTTPTLPATPTVVGVVNKYVSHPQREIYHGRAMLEIPAASVFMSSTDGTQIAKCEQCHMPATYSDNGTSTGLNRYADRNGKRYSHRMFIMMPGDAKAWGLAPWGDSCSPCHSGESQDSLQADIDTWQSTASTLATQVTNAINAAVTAHHNTTVADADLLRRAEANLSLFQQDGSYGVHNPEYEQAGLTKAVQLAKSAGGTLSISAPHSVGGLVLFGIAGTALNGDGSAAADVTVTLWNGSTKLSTAVTDDNGNYAFAYAASSTKTYTVLWERSSQSVSDLTASATVQVEKVPTALSLTRSASSVKAGAKFTLKGELNPDQTSSVKIQYKKPHTSTWKTLVVKTTSSDGTYSYTYSTKTKGTWQFRTVFAGTATYLGSTSATVKVLVK